MLVSLSILNGVLIYIFSDLILGGEDSDDPGILGGIVGADVGVGIIFLVLIVVLIYGAVQYSYALKYENMILNKLNTEVLNVQSTKSSTCFVNTKSTSDDRDSGVYVQDVLTKDISVSFQYISQSYDDWLKEIIQKLIYDFCKLFYDIEPKRSAKLQETSAFCDFTPPTTTPNTQRMTGNYIEIKVNVVVSSYSTPTPGTKKKR